MMVPEKTKPDIIAPPNPRHKGSERVIGIKPKIVANVVKEMASSLDEAPSAIDSANPNPVF